MRNNRFGTTRMRMARGGRLARAFSLSELMVVVLIIVVVLAVAVPSFTTIARDVENKQARGEVYAALNAVRSRALRDRQMVALHIFRDTAAYRADRKSTDPSNDDYSKSDSFRWGVVLNPTTLVPDHGVPHEPTNKLTMRLEVPNPFAAHVAYGNPKGAQEFIYLNDYEPVVIPQSLGVARPDTFLNRYVWTEADPIPPHYEDFYIVFDAEGKATTELIDYDLADLGNGTSNTVRIDEVDNAKALAKADATWSVSSLSIYDMQKLKSLSGAAQYDYVNHPTNIVTISAYTGMPLSMEATK